MADEIGTDWALAPAGLAVLSGPERRVSAANPTLLDWLGRTELEVVGPLCVTDLLAVGARIYWETHLAPILAVEGRLDEVAVELRTDSGPRPVLLSAVVHGDDVHLALSGASERRRYESELLGATRRAESSEARVLALQAVTADLAGAAGVAAVVAAVLACGPSFGLGPGEVWPAGEDLTGRRLDGTDGTPTLPGSAAGVLERAELVGDRVLVPLLGLESLQGVAAFDLPHGPGAEPPDLTALTSVGRQTGLALERARLFEHSATVALALQRSLLAGELPADPRLGAGAVYRPGVSELEVGGDFHDVVRLDDDRVALVVGDVVGRGLGAATAMGQLRSAVRALATTGLGPAALLDRLDAFVDGVPDAAMSTLVYGVLHLGTGELTYACAGHPPPLLLPADGGGELLWGGRSLPLGAHPSGVLRSEATHVLGAGERLVLYTDGLVERRERDLDDGLSLLAVVAGESRWLPAAVAVESLTASMLVDEEHRDDVCVLVVDRVRARLEISLAADLSTLATARRRLKAWLDGLQLPPEVVGDLVLAGSEAMANAGEHGGALQAGTTVRLSGWVEDTDHGADVVLEVRDPGQWRTTGGRGDRGRGLSIIRALVDDVQTLQESGTVLRLRRSVLEEQP